MKWLGVVAAFLVLAGCQTVDYANRTNSTDEYICKGAINLVRPVWDNSTIIYKFYVSEAKRRGLTEQQCARLSKSFSEQQIIAVHGRDVLK